MKKQYRVVNTDNFGSDYPDERWVGPPRDTIADAKVDADGLNAIAGEHSSRYYKVVQLPYKLQPGFQP